MSLTWQTALAWRLRQQLLDPTGTAADAAVVRHLNAVPAWPEESAELAIRTRQQSSRAGAVARAVADGELIKTFAFRGATYLMTPEDAGAHLALRASSRMWERPGWQTHYSLTPADWPPLRETVREALAGGPLTREELGAAVTADRRFRHLDFAFTDQSFTLLKAFAWQGDMSLGAKGGRIAFQRLDANPRWQGLLDLDDAGVRAVTSYFKAYGPATAEHLHYWLGNGLGAGRKRITTWIAALDHSLAEVDVEGEPAYILRDDREELHATPPTQSVRLLPAYDQWVLGPGTADPHVVPPNRRALISRGANIVILGGVVSGTWSLKGEQAIVGWFDERGTPPESPLAAEVARLAEILDRPLRLRVEAV